MDSESPKLEMVFIPFIAPGHMIPMVDLARLIASHGVRVTIIITTHNALIFKKAIDRDIETGNPINLHILPFPFAQVGLPEGIENLGSLTSPDQTAKVSMGAMLLQKPIEQILRDRAPDCIVSDMFYPWTADVAAQLGIPRIWFQGSSFTALCAAHSVESNAPHEKVTSDTETFVVPGLPDRLEMTRLQLPDHVRSKTPYGALLDLIGEAETRSYGVLMNSFYELEPSYIDHFKSVIGKKAWHIGPVSLCLSKYDKANRGQNSVVDAHKCLSWLDSKKANSVLYVSFGSLAKFRAPQLHEIALALQASSHPFIWVIRYEETTKDQMWLPDGFKERMNGLMIHGWAPQVLILEHPAIGGFMTHCGWNSILESVTAGVPLIAWPMYAEQFYNEKLVTQIAKIGVGVGAEEWYNLIDDERKVLVKREKIEKAVLRLMDSGDEAEKIRERAKEFGEKAKSVVEVGGSSYNDLTGLIDELVRLRASTAVGWMDSPKSRVNPIHPTTVFNPPQGEFTPCTSEPRA
ncbi:hypothetical protein GIB67_007388 [Kingdonia uniflora]|uniref:Glycosyltransferase n=1 Tax=Kingdonia uniflora TaxID=39325 RepID=A0A7J7MLJ0_9MAGN|nr:hypothetical protein GIB67_007388 [Kingdonia uniflora]